MAKRKLRKDYKGGTDKTTCLKCLEPFLSLDKTRNRICQVCNKENQKLREYSTGLLGNYSGKALGSGE